MIDFGIYFGIFSSTLVIDVKIERLEEKGRCDPLT